MNTVHNSTNDHQDPSPPPSSRPNDTPKQFELLISKEDFKFSAAHFVSHGAERERLHGHNYRVSVILYGTTLTTSDSCLIDFSEIKLVIRKLCRSMDEYFLVPTLSTTMKITYTDTQCILDTNDGSHFSLPRTDILALPIPASTVEELSVYFTHQLINEITLQRLQERHIHSVTVGITETPGQEARYTYRIPSPLLSSSTVAL